MNIGGNIGVLTYQMIWIHLKVAVINICKETLCKILANKEEIDINKSYVAQEIVKYTFI